MSVRFPLLKKVFFLSILSLTFCFTNSLAQNKGKYPALLWQISGNGLSKPSYLYGTMHVSNKLAFHLSDSFFIALKSADIIGLETNPEEWLKNMKEMGMFSGDYSGGYDFFNFGDYGDFYKTAFGFDIPDNKDLRRVLAFDPDLVNGLLYRSYERLGNHEENTYLDLFIFQAAKKMNKEVTNLEDFKESEKMVQEAMIPDPDEEDDNEGGFYRNMFGRGNVQEQIEDAYRRGDLDALDSLSRLTYPSKKYEKYMLHLRNEVMAKGMDSIMKKKVLFTGIGAAHLPGEKGVIEMLRKMGYKVRPVSFKVTKKSIKEKEKIEKTTRDLTYSVQFAPDSSFKMNLPGELTETNSAGNMRYYLYPDMVNGSYFMVVRVTTFASFLGQDQEYTMKRIDSLLYESIPGKILKNTRITSNNGWPGYEISNVTRKGDYQKYRIYAGPQEIFIFKTGGTGEFMKGAEADKFIGSIEFIEKKKAGWARFTPPTAGYSVELPQNVMYEKLKNTKPSGKTEKLQAYDPAGGDFFLVQRAVYNDFDYIEEDTFELNMFATRFADKTNLEFEYRKIANVKTGSSSLPYIQTKLKNKNDGSLIYMNIYLKGPHYYLLATRTKKNEYPARFFDSFRFEDFTFTGTFKDHTDTSMYFSVNDEFGPSTENLMSNLMNRSLLNYGQKKEKTKKDTRYQEMSSTKNYYSPSSNESIHVEFFKFNDYAMVKDKKKYWENELKYLGEDNSLVMKEKKITESGNALQYDLLFTDTASTRGIKTRVIFKDGAKWVLSANVDTTGAMSRWMDNFFKTFKPKDSVIGQSPFEDKTALYLSDIFSADSSKRDAATNSGYWVTFKKENIGEVMNAILKPEFKNLDYSIKTRLFDALRESGDDKVVAFLQKQYEVYTDSANMQFNILSVLASQQKESASKAFVELLKKETPLTNNDYDAGSIFHPFYDSLEFAKPLFPGLLDLTKFNEYKSPIYNLMATLVDKGMLPAAGYANQKALILNEGNYELKRFNANEDNANSKYEGGNYDNYDLNKMEQEMARQLEIALGKAFANNKESSDNEVYSSQRDELLNYALLLMPFYSTDASSKTFIDKLSKTKNENLQLNLSLLMLKNKLNVHDSIWKKFSADEKTRLTLYYELKELKRLDKFDSTYMNQESFCRAALYGNDYNYDSYSRDDDAGKKKDSIVFIGKYLVKNKKGEGYVYVFKRKTGESKKWKLDYAGLQPKNEKEVESGIDYTRRNLPLYEDKNIDEQIKDIVQELNLIGRKRAGGGDYSFGGGYQYDE